MLSPPWCSTLPADGTYFYDAQGLRIQKLTAEGTALYVYDQQSVLTRTDSAGTTKFEYGPDRLLSVDHPTEGRAFYVFDALGPVVNLTTPQGTLLARYQWDAWGNPRASAATVANPFGFTGHEHDSESGLIYAKARFYDPEIGVFLSQDPAAGELTNPPSLHQYLYAFQNPTVYVDPDGRIAALTDAQKRVQEGGVENAAELAEGLEEELTEAGGVVGKEASKKLSITLGIFAAGADILGEAIGVVNTGVNVVVAAVAPDSEIGQEAAEELNETINSVLDTVDVIREDPVGVGVAILKGAGETAEGVLKGDSESITRAAAFVAEALVPTPAGKVNRGKKGLDKAAEVVGAIGDLNRQRRRLQGRGPGGRRSKGPDRRSDKGPESKTPDRPESETPNLDESGVKADARSCFVDGTLVATEDGLRPIEGVRIGDRVWARNEETGEVRLREVVELFRTPGQVVYTLEFEAEDGTVETLGVTAEHPFWVKGQGWVDAAELEPGDELVTNRDGWLRVRQVRGSPDRQLVYNFEVEVDHTYFVGEIEAWVHNLCDEGRLEGVFDGGTT